MGLNDNPRGKEIENFPTGSYVQPVFHLTE